MPNCLSLSLHSFYYHVHSYILLLCLKLARAVKHLVVKDVKQFHPCHVDRLVFCFAVILFPECYKICKDRPEYSAGSQPRVSRFMCTELGGVFAKYTFVKLHISPNWFMQSRMRMNVLGCLVCGVMFASV